MKYKGYVGLIIYLFGPVLVKAQLGVENKKFTKADTLRGTITRYRQGWDVTKYDLTVQPDIQNKTISGKNTVTFNLSFPVDTMQIDLQQPLIADSITSDNKTYSFIRDGNVCLVQYGDGTTKARFKPGIRKISIYYHGRPKEAVHAPWDGGLTWKSDDNGNPFIGTACQGLGASVWWPCKDHQSDEPDSGMTITIIAPDTLSAVSNGRLINTSTRPGYKSWTWEVKNPINNYDVTMNIGKYAHWSDTLMGEGGRLDLNYWVLDYNLDKAKKQFEQVKPMLHSHEYWFGKYPFYEDGYKLVETSFLGMEHQSAVAYGNKYQNGYLGRDLSGSGWGLKWDFIIIHESGHEWFGNNITTKDVADMWVHEGFTNYSETLYTERMFGLEAAEEYCVGIRGNIKNDRPVTGPYGVNEEGSGDMYSKGANLLQNIRHSMNNDTRFRDILRGLNSTFYHQTVTASQVEAYMSKQSGFDYSKVFDQYLKTTQIPVLEYYFSKNNQRIFFKWSNCIPGFDLPLPIAIKKNKLLSLLPTEQWKNLPITKELSSQLLEDILKKKYYIEVKPVAGKS